MTALAIHAASCLAAAVISSSPLAQSSAAPTQLLRTQSAFDIIVPLPYAEAAPLFGPEGERAWAGEHWNPQFVYPLPAHDEQGAVFTLQHGPVTAIWINTLFDLDARHFQYAYLIPDILVTFIDLRFTSTSATTTAVHVVYTRTALTPEGNSHLTTFTASDKSASHGWPRAIDAYLASRKH